MSPIPPIPLKRRASISSVARRPPRRLRLAITVGDPAGIGPEVTLKTLLGSGKGSGKELLRDSEVLLVGPLWVYEQIALRYGLRVHFHRVTPGEPGWPLRARTRANATPVFAIHEPADGGAPFEIAFGREDARCGRVSMRAIETAVALAQSGAVDALVTAPICKASIHAAGSPHPGHTEMLQALTRSPRVGMMLVGGGLRVSLATIHEPLARVPRLLTSGRVLTMIRLTHEFMAQWQGRPPRLALAGLNPHAGEGGLFGTEEARILQPALARAVREGIQVEGPIPPDTVFHLQRSGQYDAVVALYHDQALIPVKTLDFDGGVNVTMGLPILRTSPDHGTAFGIAGQGVARTGSMRAALALALDLAQKRAQG